MKYVILAPLVGIIWILALRRPVTAEVISVLALLFGISAWVPVTLKAWTPKEPSELPEHE